LPAVNNAEYHGGIGPPTPAVWQISELVKKWLLRLLARRFFYWPKYAIENKQIAGALKTSPGTLVALIKLTCHGSVLPLSADTRKVFDLPRKWAHKASRSYDDDQRAIKSDS